MDFTELLPEEIIFLILSYLNGDDTFPCLGVCKRWRTILNVNTFWKKLCFKARIFNHLSGSTRDPLPLCDWAETYFHYRCIPYQHWKSGNCQYFSIMQETGDFKESCDGNYIAIYYFTKGKINLYSIFDKITIIQIIKVPLPKLNSSYNALLTLHDPYMVVSRCNVAVIFKKSIKNMYEPILSVSAMDTFIYDVNIIPRYNRFFVEVAWDCVWMTSTMVKDICVINLNDFSKKYILGRAYIAFNVDTELVVAWTKSSARIVSRNGDVLISLVREKIKAIDHNREYLILKVENGLEVININTGSTITFIGTSQKIEFVLSSTLILLEGNSTCTLSSISLENGNRIWTKKGLKGRALTLCTVGSKYLFVVPSFKKDNYSLIDYKGNFIREKVLPEGFKEFYSDVGADILPYLLVTNINSFDIISFM